MGSYLASTGCTMGDMGGGMVSLGFYLVLIVMTMVPRASVMVDIERPMVLTVRPT